MESPSHGDCWVVWQKLFDFKYILSKKLKNKIAFSTHFLAVVAMGFLEPAAAAIFFAVATGAFLTGTTGSRCGLSGSENTDRSAVIVVDRCEVRRLGARRPGRSPGGGGIVAGGGWLPSRVDEVDPLAAAAGGGRRLLSASEIRQWSCQVPIVFVKKKKIVFERILTSIVRV